MSSLAMSAALIDDNYELPKRKTQHNKTQKRALSRDVDTNKLNNLMKTLHNSPVEDSDDEMGDFSPPTPPQSAGVERTIDAKETPAMEYLRQSEEKNAERTSENAKEYRDESLDLNNFDNNYTSDSSREEYYKKFIPNYTRSAPMPSGPINKPYYTYPSNAGMGMSQQPTSQDVLLEKLNYMIHLLEEQQDERVGSVTEEVILYSFLGIFVIFLVDSFTRIGKYKR